MTRKEEKSNTTRSFKIDYKNGLNGENEMLKLLKKINTNIRKLGKYHPMDFKLKTNDKKYYFEQKTRFNCKKDTFPSTLMPKNKLDYLKSKPNSEGIFLFKFDTDSYFVKVKDLVEGKNYHIAPFKRKKRIDVVDKQRLYLHIDVDCLEHISNLTL